MNLNLKTIKQSLIWIISTVLVFASIGFAKKEKETRVCGNVIIHISNQYDNYFIDNEDILSIISRDGNLSLVGNYVENLNLRTLESSLEGEKFIRDAQVYKDLKGNIVVTAEQRRPIARVVRPDAPDAYLDEEGTILPISEKFTSRVMLLTGEYADHLIEEGVSGGNQGYMDLVMKVNSDPFWKAQIAQLDIDASGEINIYSQVSKQVVEFGLPEDIDVKFKKLEIFYKDILPFKGWNKYKRVNLTYLNQIVCE